MGNALEGGAELAGIMLGDGDGGAGEYGTPGATLWPSEEGDNEDHGEVGEMRPLKASLPLNWGFAIGLIGETD